MRRENEGIWWANEEMRSPYERIQRQIKRCYENVMEYENQMKRYNEPGNLRMEGW
jgi:hypothetical protein